MSDGSFPPPSSRRPAHVTPAADGNDEELTGFAAFRQRRRERRQAKKARIRAMSRPKRYGRRAMIAGTWFLGFIAAIMVAFIVAYFAFTNVPRPESIPMYQVATIQYADGTTLARIGSQDRTIVDIGQVPDHVKWAVLAAEDRGFYSESAISITGTARAALSDLTGGDTQGGSGITQQYVKNAYLNNAPTLSRKLKELLIAVKLSREYSKDQILGFYLNTVYFGRGAYGIEAAAEAYFGKHVEKLTVAEGALLAALLRAPSYYDPAAHLSAATQRWHYVLDGMVKTGHLSAAANASMQFPKTKKPKSDGLDVQGWKALVKDAVLAELAKHGISERKVEEQGMAIRTTISRRAQRAAVNAIKTTFAHLTHKQRNLKNALVAIDPKSGGVLAYYGGSGPGAKGYDGKVDYNDYAGRAANPPGSSFKPYTLATVLTQTLEQKPGADDFAISSKVPGDYCRTIEGTKICNDPSDKSRSGPQVELAKALKYSLNTTFDLLALDAGPANVAETAHRMGIRSKDRYGNPTLVDSQGQTGFGIGIGDYPVTPLDQASGFATLAGNGVYRAPYLVDRATASNGQPVYEHGEKVLPVLNPRVANDVTLAMEPIAKWSGVPLADGRKSAAKTGTEGIGTKTPNNSDAWMVGFTPQVSAAVWVGTGYRKPIYDANGLPEYGRDLPGRTWQMFMDNYLKGKPQAQMPKKQMIDTNGQVPTATPTPTPTDTPSAPTTSATSSSSSSSSAPTTSAPSSAPPSTPATPTTSSSTTAKPRDDHG